MGWHCHNCGHWIVDDRFTTCTYCGKPRHGGPSHPTYEPPYYGPPPKQGRGSTKRSYDYKPLDLLYGFWMVKESFVLAIIIAILATLPLKLINLGSSSLNVGILFSTYFLLNFIVILIIASIYNKITSRRARGWRAFSVAVTMSAVLVAMVNYSTITTVTDFVLLFALLFVSVYIALIIGNGASATPRNKLYRGVAYVIRIVLILVLIGILAGFAIKASLVVNYNSITSAAKNISRGISNSTGSLNIIAPQINDTWAREFFANVAITRGSPYNYCPSLSQFAGVRFNTMAPNYGISHYGYDQDFSRFYGTIYNTFFAEEVFYPSGYSPASYVSDIQTSAPLHWELLANGTLSYYGYHIQNGPTYEIYGPGGGYEPCPVTEIPGPNINISQYFAQYGCSVVTANDTWFVIELASSCP